MKFEKTGDNSCLLDVCGHRCPHPQIYARKPLETMRDSDVLHIVPDNSPSVETTTQMRDRVGHEIFEHKTEAGRIRLKIKKG